MSSQSAAAGWSPAATISPYIPLNTPNAFAGNANAGQLWVTSVRVTGGYNIKAAQRSLGGAWGSMSTISALKQNGPSVAAALSSNGYGAAAWAAFNYIEIAQYSQSDGWHTPVTYSTTGSILNLQIKLDGFGNGVAVWTRLSPSVAIVEAVTWSGAGVFSTVRQLSPVTHGSFLPSLALNETGTALVVWQAAGLLDNSSPYQVESITYSPNNGWGTVMTVSPVASQTWTPKAALDASGNAGVIWEQGAAANNYRIFASTKSATGAWSTPVKIEQANWYYAANVAIASDSAGNLTAAWTGQDSSGSGQVRSAAKSPGGSWRAAVNVGPITTNIGTASAPQVAAGPNGSIVIIGWASYGSANAPKAAVSLNGGNWVRTALSPNNAQLVYVLATNQATGSAFWPEPNAILYKMILKQSDYK